MSKYAKEIENLLKQMTLDEKVAMCHAAGSFANGGVERLGVPAINMLDGPHGVHEELSPKGWKPVGGDKDYSTCLPCSEALAATWDKEMGRLYGKVLGSEARERRKDVILAPGVNISKNPLCGRNFEYMGEDPYLTGSMATEEIKAIQKEGTGACLKHFALNSQELNRMSMDSRCDERTLREIYLAAFEMAVKEAKPATMMGAYNKFNGQHACENYTLLTQILRNEWGYEGAVVSDWAGTHDTYEAGRNGLDVEMGTPTHNDYTKFYLADAFKKALEEGEIDEEYVNEKVRHILFAMFQIGILGDKAKNRPNGERETPAHHKAVRTIAANSVVLLKNDRNDLPLDASKLKKVLVVGENATRLHCGGGGSSCVKTRHEVTPLEGIKNVLESTGAQVDFVRGYPAAGKVGDPFPERCMNINDEGAGTRGWTFNVEYKKKLVLSRPIPQPEYDPEHDFPAEFKDYAAGDCLFYIQGFFTPDKSGPWTFTLEGISQGRLRIDCRVLGTSKDENNLFTTVTYDLEEGKPTDVIVYLRENADAPDCHVRLTATFGEPKLESDEELYAKASEADAVIFCGGLSHNDDTEGTDKKDLSLRGGQNELIEKLSSVSKKLILLLNGGSPFAMPWLDKVHSVLLGWYGGTEAGNAYADVLFGKVNPSGKLTMTFPAKWEDTPLSVLDDYKPMICDYKENVFVGYRWYMKKNIKPQFPFGFGLSYSSFSISDLKAEENVSEGKVFRCSALVTNTGDKAGAEVVQLYVEPVEIKGIARPKAELKGFEKVYLEPSESKRVFFELDDRSFACFHPAKRVWYAAKGEYGIRVGNSSDNLPLRITFKHAGWEAKP